MSPTHTTADVLDTRYLAINYEDGVWWAEMPRMLGCFATGRDVPELLRNLAEAIELWHLDDRGCAP